MDRLALESLLDIRLGCRLVGRLILAGLSILAQSMR